MTLKEKIGLVGKKVRIKHETAENIWEINSVETFDDYTRVHLILFMKQNSLQDNICYYPTTLENVEVLNEF